MTSDLCELRNHYENPRYWRGGDHGYVGFDGYRDFPINELKTSYILQQANGGSVLEVGCAFGFIVNRLREAGTEARGIDISQYAIDQGPLEIRPYLQQGMAHQLPYEDKEFSYLCSFGMMEHTPSDLLLPTLQELSRVATRGLLSITMRGDPKANEDPSHASLLTFAEWQFLGHEHLGDGWEIVSDAEEGWVSQSRHRWGVVAPTIYPLGKAGYAGIERLVNLFLKGLVAHESQSDWQVSCFCPQGSITPRGVHRISSGPPLQDFSEPNLLPSLINSAVLEPNISCFLDFSHSKAAGRVNRFVPQIAPIWHDPYIMTPRVPHNVVALSQWQADRFTEIYNQECIVLDPICGDGDVLCPLEDGHMPVDDYLVFLGKLSPDKGALEAIQACKALRQKLIVIGAVTPGDPPAYVQQVLNACDGEDVQYFPQVTGEQKVHLFRNAKALFYPVSYPEGQGEAHSHKGIEAMLCGTPCIFYDQGAMKEVVDEGETGFVIKGRSELMDAINECELLDRHRCREKAMERWDYRQTIKTWIPFMDMVSRGLRW